MGRLRRFLVVAGAVVAVTAVGAPALAHHSAAMFDSARTERVEGVVSSLEWTNPHVWLTVRGVTATWSFEMPGPGALARMGFTQAMLATGTKVSVEHHPLRDGRRGGLLLTVTFADGKTLRAAGR